jgi:C-terminal processing protease CtpA/Prc
LSDILTFYLDDIHSGMDINSFRTYEPASQEGNGLSRMQIIADYSRFKKARDDSKHKVIPYEEVGNTAYVTFDSFNLPRTAEAYYQMESEPEADDFDLENPNIDTVALIMYAHRQITRKDSPVENVVLDLSLNDGGAIDAAVAVAAWFLGEAKVSMQSTFTGARSTGVYQADINLDGEYDEKDTVSDKNLYCLISPNSFSCGNLVPAILKNAHSVTLIGQTSGGGSCEVNGLTTAYGSFFSISSPNISTLTALSLPAG